MEIPSNIIDRYKKICALAERGQANEASNAKTIKERMERKHPGIHKIAFPPSTNEAIFEEFRTQAESTVWENFSNRASDFFTKVKDFTFNAIGIQAAKNMVNEGRFTVRDNTSSVSVTYKMPDDLIDRLYDLNEEERFAFLEEAAQQFADHLSLYVYSDEEDVEY